MFGKKKNSKKTGENVPVKEDELILGTDEATGSKDLSYGVPTIKDLMAPPSMDRSASDHLVIGNKYVRNFIIAGYPKMIAVGWADAIYNYDGDLDLALHVTPMDERNALDELTNKITQFEAQLATEQEKGSNRNITRLQYQI